MSEWQTIETCPPGDVAPDEEWVMVLACNQRGGIEVVNARRVYNARQAAANDDEACWFTHWMPLPTPPQTAST